MAAVAVAVIAVACCAGLPAIVAVLGGLTLAGMLGVGSGIVVAAAVIAAIAFAWRERRRRGASSKESTTA